MNLHIAIVTALLVVTASPQARTLVPHEAQQPRAATARPVPVHGITPPPVPAIAMPAVTIALPAKAPIALPAHFEKTAPALETIPQPSPRPPAWGHEWTGPIMGTTPGTRYPPIVAEPPTQVPSPYCGAGPC